MKESTFVTLGQYTEKIGTALTDIASQKPPLREELVSAMEYSLTAGGKRIRPVLMLEFCRMCGGDSGKYTDIACSIELVHTFSLIHDDLPCMDNDDFRRGKPSCHKKFGEATALLAGCALNNLAYEIITDSVIDGVIDPNTAVMLISALSKAIGVKGMIGGQEIDMNSEDREISSEELDLLQSCKTGALIEAACVMGVILSGKYEMIPMANEYAAAFGRAFQIVDDILDVTGTFEQLGKPIGSDAQQNKNTYVTKLGYDAACQKAGILTKQALNSLRQFEDHDFLYDLTDSLLHRKS